MSWTPTHEPACHERDDDAALSLVIEGRPRDIGAFEVRRVLPSVRRRMVGPFIFFDHIGPAEIPAGTRMDVRPHPHVNLSTVTYLFEGEIMHRDSLGSVQTIRPGAINWMTAGRGIVHSERTPPGGEAVARRMHGVQMWVALPTAHEEIDPAFAHYPADVLPQTEVDGVRIRVLAGSAYGHTSPVATLSRLFAVEAALPTGATLPIDDAYPERGIYVATGAVRFGGERFEPGRMLVLEPGHTGRIVADEASQVLVVGGEPLDGPRHISWNFVSSSKERIAEVGREWAGGPGHSDRFPPIPGDDDEFIPLPR